MAFAVGISPVMASRTGVAANAVGVPADTLRGTETSDTLRRTNPEYPGGVELMRKFFHANIRPELSYALGQSGKVVARFIVEKDGRLTNVEILEHGTPEMDEEVMAVIRKMPRWNPGTRNGKPVRVRISQAFNFHSNKDAGYKPDMKRVAKARRAKEESMPADNLYVIDGRKASKEESDKLDATKIVSMKALKRKETVKLYGKEGRNGAIVVVTDMK